MSTYNGGDNGTSKEKLHQQLGLDSLKNRLQQEVLNCMINNILDQNGASSIAGLFSLFDLSSYASKESRIKRLSQFHDIYGTPVLHTMKETW